LKEFEETDERPYFLWHLYFMDVLEKDGFDIVIGNPPYQRIQGIRKEDPKFADQLVELYDSATGSFDLYVTFAEKGLQLCKPDGVLNFIMPVKWTNSAFGKGLRQVMTEQKAVNRIISFSAYQVFNASTYTGLQWFKRESEQLLYAELTKDLPDKVSLGKYLESMNNGSYNTIEINNLSEDEWILTTKDISVILDQLDKQPKKVSSIFSKIFQGIATSKDSVYFLFDCIEDENYISGYSKELEREVKIEKGLVKPLLKGDQFHRYDQVATNSYVIVPYKITVDDALLFSEKEIKELFPFGYSYLKENEQILRNRERGRLLNDDYWFRYIYPKNLTLFQKVKLISPEISYNCNFSYDKFGEFYSTTKVYGYLLNEDYIKYYRFYLSILNSKVLWFFMKNTGYTLRGGYFTFKTNYLNPFPLPDVNEVTNYSTFETLAEVVLYLKTLSNVNISNSADNEHIALFFEDIIDGCVYELYFREHMKEQEINILEMVSQQVQSIEGKEPKEAREIILNTWLKMRKSEIAERMRQFTVKSPDILKPIIQS
jgi:hypothetical protein